MGRAKGGCNWRYMISPIAAKLKFMTYRRQRCVTVKFETSSEGTKEVKFSKLNSTCMLSGCALHILRCPRPEAGIVTWQLERRVEMPAWRTGSVGDICKFKLRLKLGGKIKLKYLLTAPAWLQRPAFPDF